MKNKFYLQFWIILLILSLFQNAVSQNIANYEDLNLSTNSYWNGNDNSGGFNNASFFFENNYTSFGGGMYAWYGFAYSNMTDTLTTGYTNQFSAITGKGALNSANYAVSYVNYDFMNNYKMHPNTIRFTTPQLIRGFYFTNATYAYFSMLNGDGTLAKKFGGISGNDADWLKLQIKGYRNGGITDTVDCFLADFRFTNNALDYILKTWKWVDLTVLGDVDSLSFGLTSSDNGAYGMNTPAYFCMDDFNGVNPNLTVNEINKSNKQINIYPNPFTETIQLQAYSNDEILRFQIYDLSGKEIRKKDIVNQKNIINLSDLTAGIYFIKLTGSDFYHFQKIIKK
jgi:hypothetical protein